MEGLGTHLCVSEDNPSKERRIKVGGRMTEVIFLIGEGAGYSGVIVDFIQEDEMPALIGRSLVNLGVAHQHQLIISPCPAL